MKRVIYPMAFALLAGALPIAANADNAYTLRDVEVYTGPGSEYPPVATLPPNMGVNVAGCLSDWSWCDVIFADNRGWVYAGDLGYPYQNNRVAIVEYGPRLGLPVVTFSLPVYWDAHYRSRPWYRERDVWVNRVHAEVDRGGRPPEGRTARGAPPAAGAAPAPQTSAPQGQTQQPAPQPQYTQPRQQPETMQRPNAPQTSPSTQSQQTQPQNQTAPNARAREGAPPTTPSAQSQPSTQAPASPPSSMQQGRGPETRPPENRPPENRPPEGRPPEGRPAAGQPPATQGAREGGPPGQREGQPPGQREGQGQARGQGGGDQGRGEGGPDRDRQ